MVTRLRSIAARTVSSLVAGVVVEVDGVVVDEDVDGVIIAESSVEGGKLCASAPRAVAPTAETATAAQSARSPNRFMASANPTIRK
jgi:hypothetical protein